MKNYILFMSLLVLSTVQPRFGDMPNEYIAVSFAGLYPISPLRKVKVLATQLWAEVNAATKDERVREKLENSIVDFAHTVLDLYSLCDLLMNDVQAQINKTGVRYHYKNTEKMLEEMRYLSDLIGSLEQTFDKVMNGHVSDQAACVKVVLNCIKKKMERTLQSAP